MFNFKEFLGELQQSSDARKLRWLLGSSLFIGGLVVIVWSGYFAQTLTISEPVLVEGSSEEIAQNEPRVLSMWEVMGRQVGYMADVVSSFFKESAIPVPNK